MIYIKYFTEDINKCLETKAYFAALALSLTLIDICSKIACSNEKTQEDRYAKFVNQYIYPNHSCTNFGDESYGDILYALRCKFLHEGETPDSTNVKNNTKHECDEYNFELQIFEPALSNITNGSDSFGSKEYDNGDGTKIIERHIKLNLVELCKKVVAGCDLYIKESQKENFFDNKTLNIIIIQKSKTESNCSFTATNILNYSQFSGL